MSSGIINVSSHSPFLVFMPSVAFIFELGDGILPVLPSRAHLVGFLWQEVSCLRVIAQKGQWLGYTPTHLKVTLVAVLFETFSVRSHFTLPFQLLRVWSLFSCTVSFLPYPDVLFDPMWSHGDRGRSTWKCCLLFDGESEQTVISLFKNPILGFRACMKACIIVLSKLNSNVRSYRRNWIIQAKGLCTNYYWRRGQRSGRVSF